MYRSEPVAAHRADVGDHEPRARVGEAATEVGTDIAGALHCDRQPIEFPAQREPGGDLHRFEHALRGPGRRIAARAPFDRGQARDMARDRGDLLHVLDRRADILCGDVEAAQRLDRAAESAEQRDAVPFALGPPQHRFGSAERQAGERILVAHAFGKAHGIGERVARVGIGPQPAPAGARPQRGRVNRDKPVEPRFEIVKPHAFERRGQTGKTNDHETNSLDGRELVAFSRGANLID